MRAAWRGGGRGSGGVQGGGGLGEGVGCAGYRLFRLRGAKRREGREGLG